MKHTLHVGVGSLSEQLKDSINRMVLFSHARMGHTVLGNPRTAIGPHAVHERALIHIKSQRRLSYWLYVYTPPTRCRWPQCGVDMASAPEHANGFIAECRGDRAARLDPGIRLEPCCKTCPAFHMRCTIQAIQAQAAPPSKSPATPLVHPPLWNQHLRPK